MVEFQSKAGPCILKDYSVTSAPDEVLRSIREDTWSCGKCYVVVYAAGIVDEELDARGKHEQTVEANRGLVRKEAYQTSTVISSVMDGRTYVKFEVFYPAHLFEPDAEYIVTIEKRKKE